MYLFVCEAGAVNRDCPEGPSPAHDAYLVVRPGRPPGSFLTTPEKAMIIMRRMSMFDRLYYTVQTLIEVLSLRFLTTQDCKLHRS